MRARRLAAEDGRQLGKDVADADATLGGPPPSEPAPDPTKATASSAAAAAAVPTTTTTTTKGPLLRQAELVDLLEGNVIYVRGKQAACRNVEYPLVYWSYSGQDDIVKHRSYAASRDIFQVPADGPQPAPGLEKYKEEQRIEKNHAMLKAAFDQDWPKVFAALNQGADVNCADEDGDRLLHFAASKGVIEVMKRLIDIGADVNATDEDGWSALHHATMFGYSKVLSLLLDSGADILAKNDEGNTVLDMLETEEVNDFCRKVLQEAWAKQEKK